MTASTATTVQYLNLAYFGRPADPASLSAFPASGMTDEQIVAHFVKTSEYTTNTVTPNSSTNPGGGTTVNQTNLINTFYQRLFGRLAVAEEVTGWTNALAQGTVNEDYLGITIMRAALNLPASTEMRQVMVAKFDSAQAFTDNLAANPASSQAYSNSAAITSAASYLTGITSTTAATAAEAASAVSTMVAASNGTTPDTTAQTLTLTTGIDSLTGGAGNDTFNAGLSDGGTQTFHSADSLTGGGGTDTVSIITNTAGTYAPTTSSIENVTLNNIAAGAVVLDTTNLSGVSKFTALTPSAQALNFNNIAATSTDLEVSGMTLAATVTFDFLNASVTGGSDAANLTVNSSTTGTVVVDNAIETLSVTASGSANTLTALTNSANTLNVAGSSDLTITGANTTAETITSTSTGAFTSTSNNTNAVTYTGGAGADTFTLTGAAVITDTVNLGAGNDTVIYTANLDDADIADGGAGTDAVAGISADLLALTVANNLSNFETVRVTDALGGNITLATIQSGIDTLRLDTATAAARTATFEAGSKTVDLRAVLGGALTVNDSGTATSDTLTIQVNDVAANATGGQNLVIGGFETLNIVTSSDLTGAATAQTVGTVAITADTGGSTAFNVSGSNSFTTTGAITAGTIDASGLTGSGAFTMGAAAVGGTTITGGLNADTLLAAATGSTLNGGAGADTLTGGAGVDTINGGAGADTIVTGGANDTVDGGAGNDTITGGTGNESLTGGTGNDTIVSGGGNDTIAAGDGNDTVNMDATLTANDTVTGGAGTDVLALDAAATAVTAANVSGFETLRLDTAALTQDMAVFSTNNAGITTLDVNVAGAATFTNVADTVTTLQNTTTGGTATLTRLVDGTTNALTIAADDSNATTSQGVTTFAAVTAVNEETITLTSGSNAAEILTVTTLTVADLTTLNLTGTANVVVTNAIAGATALATVDASALTGASTVNASASTVAVTMTSGAGAATYTGGSGNDTITGSGVADTLTGGAGSDTITGGGGADTLAGGAGNDTITGGAGGDTITGGAGVDTITAGAGADTVTGGAGADVIDITGTGAIDNVVLTAGNALNEAIGIDVITGFDTASVANLGDNIDIDLSDINNALNAGTLLTGDGTDSVVQGTPVLTAVTAGGYDLGGANTDILVLAGNYSSTDEVETALEAGGSHALTSDDANGNYTATDAFLVLYDNDVNSFLATFSFAADPGDNATFAAGGSTVTNILQINGVDDVTDFVTGHFDIIA